MVVIMSNDRQLETIAWNDRQLGTGLRNDRQLGTIAGYDTILPFTKTYLSENAFSVRTHFKNESEKSFVTS